MAFEGEICVAIHDRRLIQIYYIDPVPGWRVVEPYTLGYNLAGDLILNGWFDAGASASNEGPGFRDYHTDKITECQILSQHFAGPASGWVRGEKKFQRVVCDLST